MSKILLKSIVGLIAFAMFVPVMIADQTYDGKVTDGKVYDQKVFPGHVTDGKVRDKKQFDKKVCYDGYRHDGKFHHQHPHRHVFNTTAGDSAFRCWLYR